MQDAIFNVPFFYEMTVIKKRCQKTSTVIVKSTHPVKLKRVANADVAPTFDVDFCLPGEKDTQHIFTIPLVDGRLYQPKDTHLTAEVAEDMSRSGFDNPFARTAEKAGRFCNNVINERDIPSQAFREVFSDTRDDVTSALDDIAKNYVIADGVTYTPIGEPYYYVTTLGLGNNHGGTVLNVGYTYEGKPQIQPAFNASQLELAKTFADQVAAGRGDTKHIGIGPLYQITVHRPEDITLPEGQIPTDETA